MTVIDLTTALAGPYATFLLAGLGARVIKVENPAAGDTSRTNAPYLGREGIKLARDRDDDMSITNINRSRNKLGVTLNLKHPAAREVFADLVRDADIVVENFSRGTVERLGVGYSFASSVTPRIVYCSISGFGQDGEPGGGKAMDAIIQAMSGLMLTSGGPGDPPIRVGVPVADLQAPLFAVIGILSAVHQARQTGVGQYLDISMLGVLSSLVAGEHFDVLDRLGVPLRTGSTLPRLTPFGVYSTSDGWIALAAPTDAFAAGVFRAIGHPELNEDPRFRSRDQRVRHTVEVDALIRPWTAGRTRGEALAALEAEGVPCAPVRSPIEAVQDPDVLRRGEVVRLEHPTYGAIDEVYGAGLPIRFSNAEVGFDRPAPWLGEHNTYVYQELLGYDADRLAALQSEGAI
ncbi:MAG: CoA transferase [Chloroflexi bacterium]|nr:CoA transferase [Chloroflexota bacterium]